MKQFTTTVEMNATATAVVKANSLEEAKANFKAGDYELIDHCFDGVAESGFNEEAVNLLEEDVR